MSRKMAMNELLEAAAATVNGEGSMFPAPWPHRLGVVELTRGVRIPVEIGSDDSLTEIPKADVVSKVMRWMRLHQNPEWYLQMRHASEVVDQWIAIATPIQLAQIRHVRWATETGYAWRKLPWDASEGETPTWDSLLARLSNMDAFCAFVGSLMFDEARQHQYLWCYGVGGDGKGAINRWLANVFGRAYRSKHPPAPQDRFWTYGLIGSRVVVLPDCNSRGFTSSGVFKALSGGDPVDVEAKGQMSFTVTLGCKFIFFSNSKPQISSEKADIRRIIYCEFTGQPEIAHDFEDRLWDEGGRFLTKCVNAYVSMCGGHGIIPSDQYEVAQFVSENEEQFEDIFDRYFCQTHTDHHSHAALATRSTSAIDDVTLRPDVLQAILRDELKDRQRQVEFREWLCKRFGVQKRSIERRENGVFCENIKRYVGITLRENLRVASAARLTIVSREID